MQACGLTSPSVRCRSGLRWWLLVGLLEICSGLVCSSGCFSCRRCDWSDWVWSLSSRAGPRLCPGSGHFGSRSLRGPTVHPGVASGAVGSPLRVPRRRRRTCWQRSQCPVPNRRPRGRSAGAGRRPSRTAGTGKMRAASRDRDRRSDKNARGRDRCVTPTIPPNLTRTAYHLKTSTAAAWTPPAAPQQQCGAICGADRHSRQQKTYDQGLY